MRVYKIHALVAAGTNDAIAQLDIVEDGKIAAVAWAAAPLTMDGFTDEFRVELGFGSANTLDNNDVRQSISEIGTGQNINGASAGGPAVMNHSISGLELNVIAGERIFLHSFASAGVSGRVSCHIYIKDGSGGSTRQRRPR